METVFCVECGARNNGKSRFCAKCGSRLTSESRWGDPVIVPEVKMSEKYTNQREVSYRHEKEIVAESLNQKQDKAPMLALILACVGLYLNFTGSWSIVLGARDWGLVENLLSFATFISYILIVIGICMYRRKKTFFCGIGFILLALLAAIDLFTAYNSFGMGTLLSFLKIDVFILCGLGYFLNGKVRAVFTRIGGIALIVVSVITILFMLVKNFQYYSWNMYHILNINYLQPIMLGIAVLLYCPKKKI